MEFCKYKKKGKCYLYKKEYDEPYMPECKFRIDKVEFIEEGFLYIDGKRQYYLKGCYGFIPTEKVKRRKRVEDFLSLL